MGSLSHCCCLLYSSFNISPSDNWYEWSPTISSKMVTTNLNSQNLHKLTTALKGWSPIISNKTRCLANH